MGQSAGSTIREKGFMRMTVEEQYNDGHPRILKLLILKLCRDIDPRKPTSIPGMRVTF